MDMTVRGLIVASDFPPIPHCPGPTRAKGEF
jgi:hypothetical protein